MNRILQAAHFAAIKHSQHRRKNVDATPYINHPIEVAEHLSRIGGITDEDVLVAALLHDTIEDTETTREEIMEIFGPRVAGFVVECTDNKSLEKPERKRLQILTAPHKSNEAKMIKIADKTCNLASILMDPPDGWNLQRQKEYFLWAEQVVQGLLGVNVPMDRGIAKVLEQGKMKLGAI